MKTISHLSIILLFTFLISCGDQDNSDVEQHITKPVKIDPPQGAVFEKLLFEYDFEGPHKGIQPNEYSTEYVHSQGGKRSYEITNKRQFGIGYNNEIPQAYNNHYFFISCDVFKTKASISPNNSKGFFVVSIHRGTQDSTVFYTKYPIADLLRGQNKQHVDKWENLAIWYKIPRNLQAGDRVKIYPWNPHGGSIYLDNFIAEVWNRSPNKPTEDYVLSHVLTEVNYEDATAGHTKEAAARGIGSIIISKNNAKFGRGYDGTLGSAKANPGDYVHVTFQAFKHHKVINSLNQATLVSSIRTEKFFYYTYSINERIRTLKGQAFQEWINLETWFQIPEDVNPEDAFKIYTFNPYAMPIYIDDLKVEIWKKNAAEPAQ
ncbi:MAG: hypothetical protein MK212_21825 [Saprospiraceae bacterium]|nr:hypothetical protein [Saprospiraceae bacterium]